MGKSELNKAIKIINNSTTAHFAGRKAEELILKAEKFLNLKFPSTYREFLITFGCGSINGFEFFGITDDNFENSTIPNAIWLTNKHRIKNKLPKSLILVADSDEGYFAIDLAKIGKNEEGIVVEVTGKSFQEHQKVAEDFGEFLFTMVTKSMTF
jgi:antitoxin YobK